MKEQLKATERLLFLYNIFLTITTVGWVDKVTDWKPETLGFTYSQESQDKYKYKR